VHAKGKNASFLWFHKNLLVIVGLKLLGKYGRMGLPQLQQLAAQAQEDDTPVTPEQVETWARNLVDAEQKCFLAVSVHRSVRRLLLINIGV